MNRSMIVSLGLGLAMLSLAIVVQAQRHRTAADGYPVESHPDERQALDLGPSAEAGLKLTMREHLEAIRNIIAALGRQEFDKAASVAHEELGFPKHHQAMEREAGATFPPKYHELAMAHHQEAEDLAKVIPSKDLKTILPHIEKTIGSCVACRRAYKL